ncbi:MAG: hypothetical protein ABL898_14185 [Hyphomicrobiaceae bacterium]|nr:hypothetical protein [Hyphomicrobiaceae bacterium]
MIDQSKYHELNCQLDDINCELRWRQMSDYGRKEFASYAPKRRWSNSEIRDVRASIERLPAVKAKLREIPAGSETPLGELCRYYANLTFQRAAGSNGLGFVGMHGAATSLANYMRRLDDVGAKWFHGITIVPYAAAASTVQTVESPSTDREGNPFDITTNRIDIRMSLAAFELVAPIFNDALRRHASRPEIVVILSSDVDSRLSFATRDLEAGQGQTFAPVISGPFQPVRWHLHVFEPPPWPVPGWQAERQWLPNDHAVDHPTQTWVIEEFAGPSRDNLVGRLCGRAKAYWIQMNRPSA